MEVGPAALLALGRTGRSQGWFFFLIRVIYRSISECVQLLSGVAMSLVPPTPQLTGHGQHVFTERFL